MPKGEKADKGGIEIAVKAPERLRFLWWPENMNFTDPYYHYLPM
jgi:hypothetical protein